MPLEISSTNEKWQLVDKILLISCSLGGQLHILQESLKQEEALVSHSSETLSNVLFIGFFFPFCHFPVSFSILLHWERVVYLGSDPQHKTLPLIYV